MTAAELRNAAVMRSAQEEYDNRAEPEASPLDAIRWAVADARATLSAAESAAECGEFDKATEMLHSAGAELCDFEGGE